MFENIDYNAIIVAFAVFIVGVAIAWANKRYELTDSIGFIALIILPFVAYGVASGYIAKISVPGGWAAEFREIARAEIKPTKLTDEVEDLRVFEKGGLARLEQFREQVEIGKPIAISLRIGRQGFYNERAIAEYIRSFLTFDPDLTMIFVEERSGQFVASANGNSVLAALELQGFNQRFLEALENADLLALRRLVVLTANSVDADTTNAQALQMMISDGVDAIVKTDPGGLPVGIVRRDEIVSRLMVRLAGG